MKQQQITINRKKIVRTMLNQIMSKGKLFGVTALLGFASCSQAQQQTPQTTLPVNPGVTQTNPAESTAVQRSNKKIKVAILLDTSGSMDGLIEQAKNQLWKIVNQLAKAKDAEGKDPYIELALYHYGNDGLLVTDGYVQQISGFTSELDDLSAQLFALQTNGGSEYCGTAIKKSITELNWSDNPDDLQVVFICGNEAFTQGAVSYQKACGLAKNKNVLVNTIFCGDYHQGIRLNWQHGAALTGGEYMNINHDAQIVHINSPYDVQIQQLNIYLNQSYVPYGTYGKAKKENQEIQDANANGVGASYSTSRVLSKSSKVYKNKSWDLVDAVVSESFQWSAVSEEALPDTMVNMTTDQRKLYVETQAKKRKEIQAQIQALGKKRELYVLAEKKKLNVETQLDDVMNSTIKTQARSKSFSFE